MKSFISDIYDEISVLKSMYYSSDQDLNPETPLAFSTGSFNILLNLECCQHAVDQLFKMLTQFLKFFGTKLAEARTETEKIDVGGADNSRKSKEAYLINLNEDPMLSGVICHFLNSGETSVGRKDASPVPNICLSGLRSVSLMMSVKTERSLRVTVLDSKTMI